MRISKNIASQWPPSEYPVHIQIVGGVAGFGYMEEARDINVSFDPALITPAELDERMRAPAIDAIRTTEHGA